MDEWITVNTYEGSGCKCESEQKSIESKEISDEKEQRNSE